MHFAVKAEDLINRHSGRSKEAPQNQTSQLSYWTFKSIEQNLYSTYKFAEIAIDNYGELWWATRIISQRSIDTKIPQIETCWVTKQWE